MPERKRPSPRRAFQRTQTRQRVFVTLCWTCDAPTPHPTPRPPLPHPHAFKFVNVTVTRYFRLSVQLFYLSGHHVTDSEEECEAGLQRAKRPLAASAVRAPLARANKGRSLHGDSLLAWPTAAVKNVIRAFLFPESPSRRQTVPITSSCACMPVWKRENSSEYLLLRGMYKSGILTLPAIFLLSSKLFRPCQLSVVE